MNSLKYSIAYNICDHMNAALSFAASFFPSLFGMQYFMQSQHQFPTNEELRILKLVMKLKSSERPCPFPQRQLQPETSVTCQVHMAFEDMVFLTSKKLWVVWNPSHPWAP